jgi:hypothetical protein
VRTATFTEVYAIISERCAFCHTADHIGLLLGHLDMSSADLAYANLVGHAAAGTDCGASGKTRVMSGNPDQSLIVQKLLGIAGCGVQMPDGYPALPSEQIALIRAWIAAGAKHD